MSYADRYSVAINFVTSEDVRILRDMELYYSTQIDEMPMSMLLFFILCCQSAMLTPTNLDLGDLLN